MQQSTCDCVGLLTCNIINVCVNVINVIFNINVINIINVCGFLPNQSGLISSFNFVIQGHILNFDFLGVIVLFQFYSGLFPRDVFIYIFITWGRQAFNEWHYWNTEYTLMQKVYSSSSF